VQPFCNLQSRARTHAVLVIGSGVKQQKSINQLEGSNERDK
jgi:hypothetical protein